MKKIKLTTILAVVVMLVSIRMDVMAKVEVVGTPEGFEEAGQVVSQINKVAGEHQGKPWTVKVTGLHANNKKEIGYAVEEMRTDSGEFWAIYYSLKNKKMSIKIVNCSYTVRKNDSWASIAKRYKTTVKKLKKMNPWYESKLKKGQKVIVKTPPIPEWMKQ